MAPGCRRVVVSGIGLVTPLGTCAAETWAALTAGLCGVRPLDATTPHYLPEFLSAFPARQAALLALPCRVVAPVLPKEGGASARRFAPTSRESRAHRFAHVAVAEALADAGLRAGSDVLALACPDQLDLARFGVNIGSCFPGFHDIADCTWNLCAGDVCRTNRVSPFFVPKILPSTIGGAIAATYGLRGPCHSSSTACATGAHAIGDAARWIQHGDADVVVAGSSEACITPLTLVGFSRMKALSTRFNDSPAAASRPFDAERCGFVLGEGCGILILEELSHARRRRAPRIHCELAGYGMSGDAYHVSSPRPDGSGAAQCIRSALRDANCQAEEVGYANAHATGTQMGDEIELSAIAATLRGGGCRDGGGGGTVPALLVSSIKGAIGHLLGAAGSVEAAVTAMSVARQLAPPAINLEHPIPHDKSAVQLITAPTKFSRSAAVSTSFGFGGTNAALLFTRKEED